MLSKHKKSTKARSETDMMDLELLSVAFFVTARRLLVEVAARLSFRHGRYECARSVESGSGANGPYIESLLAVSAAPELCGTVLKKRSVVSPLVQPSRQSYAIWRCLWFCIGWSASWEISWRMDTCRSSKRVGCVPVQVGSVEVVRPNAVSLETPETF
jgi:hypothetical protein